MKIAEVSEQYGISSNTLRYYERIGLILPVHRNNSGTGATTKSMSGGIYFQILIFQL